MQIKKKIYTNACMKAEGGAQAVECLPSKSTAKKKNKKEERILV
jgi:hypothetical protein